MLMAYHAIESDTARKAVALGCPHPYLAAESVTGAAEVWWFNAYNSTVGQTQVAERTREEANALHASAGDGATILRVRPSLSFPAPEWISHDREFWTRPPTPAR